MDANSGFAIGRSVLQAVVAWLTKTACPKMAQAQQPDSPELINNVWAAAYATRAKHLAFVFVHTKPKPNAPISDCVGTKHDHDSLD